MLTENDSLSKQLDEARSKIAEVDQEQGIIEAFKRKLKAADDAREASDNYQQLRGKALAADTG